MISGRLSYREYYTGGLEFRNTPTALLCCVLFIILNNEPKTASSRLQAEMPILFSTKTHLIHDHVPVVSSFVQRPVIEI